MDIRTQGRGRGGVNCEIRTDKYTLPCVKQIVGACCTAQGAQLSILWWPREKGWGRFVRWGSKREGIYIHIYIYIYPHTHGWFTSLCSRNWHDIVKQLYPIKKKLEINGFFKKKRKKKKYIGNSLLKWDKHTDFPCQISKDDFGIRKIQLYKHVCKFEHYFNIYKTEYIETWGIKYHISE